jgi:hypothetical protein
MRVIRVKTVNELEPTLLLPPSRWSKRSDSYSNFRSCRCPGLQRCFKRSSTRHCRCSIRQRPFSPRYIARIKVWNTPSAIPILASHSRGRQSSYGWAFHSIKPTTGMQKDTPVTYGRDWNALRSFLRPHQSYGQSSQALTVSVVDLVNC